MEPCDFSLETGSAAETQTWGSRLAALLKPGDVLALAGDLGAGKTAFTIVERDAGQPSRCVQGE